MQLEQLIHNLHQSRRDLRKFIEENEDELRECFSSCRLDETHIAYIPVQILTQLVDLMPYRRARRTIQRALIRDRPVCLRYISEKQRLLIVNNFMDKSKALEMVRLSQELETCAQELLWCTIMTGKLPLHYPTTMSTCCFCGRGYEEWQSVWLTHCERHSYHEDCYDGKRGDCPIDMVTY
jgi:hypothetical protein